MTNIKKIVSMLLMMTVLMTGFSFTALAEESNEDAPVLATLDGGGEDGDIPEITVVRSAEEGDRCIAVEWTEIPEAHHYSVRLVGSNRIFVTNDTCFEFTDLTPGRSYDVLIKAQDETNTTFVSGTLYDQVCQDADPDTLQTIRGYKSVKLKWEPVEGADKYSVYVSKNNTMPENSTKETSDCSYTVSDMSRNATYYFWVVAYNSENPDEPVATLKASAKCVRTMYYTITMKVGGTYKCTCHKGKKKHKIKLSKGEVINTHSFNNGRHDYSRDGHNYKISMLKVKTAENDYDSSVRYTDEEAEFFITAIKPYKKSKKLIWVNLYTQHVYVFELVNGKYHVVRDFGCASGKAVTPSITGLTRRIYKRMKFFNKRTHWNVYFSSQNAIHGLIGNEKIDGATHSHGCIRVNNVDNDWIWSNVAKNSSLVVF